MNQSKIVKLKAHVKDLTCFSFLFCNKIKNAHPNGADENVSLHLLYMADMLQEAYPFKKFIFALYSIGPVSFVK